MNARLILSALALTAVPQALAGQAGTEATAAVAVEAAVQAGLPAEPVRHTIAEGRARGASEAQIARAAGATHARLHASREALRRQGSPEPTSAEIVAGADALLSGADASDLEQVRGSAPAERSLVTSLTLLAALTSRGEDSATAATAIATRLEAGDSDSLILNLAADGAGSLLNEGVSATVGADVGAAAGIDLLGTTSTLGTSVVGGLGVGR